MASPNVARVTESPLFRAIGPTFNAILAAAVIGVGTRVMDRMDRMEAFINAAQTDKATMELRMKRSEEAIEGLIAANRALTEGLIRLQDRVDSMGPAPRKDRS
jgi:hypothetical protein